MLVYQSKEQLRSVALAALQKHFFSNRGLLPPSRLAEIADELLALIALEQPVDDLGARLSQIGLSFASFSAAGLALTQHLLQTGDTTSASAAAQRLNTALYHFHQAEVRRLHDEHEQMQAAVTTALADTHREAQELQQEISERKRVEASLERDKAAAEAASRAKSTFLANMSHELRTPLNAILGYAQILQIQAASGSDLDIQPTLAKIRTAGNHLLAIISDVLDLSRIEADKVALYIDTFDVETLIGELTTTATPLVAKHDNTLVVDCATDVGVMCSDLQRARQVLLNLLSNAAKFTRNGVITLSAARDEHHKDWLVFSVADTGIGMEEGFHAALFKPFAQVAPRSNNQSGAGLGLAISRHLTRMLGGEITVASAPGQGSIFTVRLPAVVSVAGSEK